MRFSMDRLAGGKRAKKRSRKARASGRRSRAWERQRPVGKNEARRQGFKMRQVKEQGPGGTFFKK